MTDMNEIISLVEKQGKAWQDALGEIRKDVREIEKKANRPGAGASSDAASTKALDVALKTFGRTGDDSKLVDLHKKAMNSGSDPDGGYLIIPEMDSAIDRIAQASSAMARLANNVTIGTQKWQKLVKTAGMAMRRVANGATGGETTEPVFAQVEIEVFPAEVEPWIHNETLEDATQDLGADLANEAGIAFAEGAAAEYITGNGVGGARGILTYPVVADSAFAWGSVGYIASGKSAAFASVAPADKLIDLVTALKPEYRNGASFLMNDKTLAVCRQMKDGSGSYYLWQADPTKPFGGTLLGYPVSIDSNMPDLGVGSLSIAFGDFKRGYAIVSRTGVTLIRDNITAKGQTKFNFRKRFGGGVTHFEAIKLMKFSA